MKTVITTKGTKRGVTTHGRLCHWRGACERNGQVNAAKLQHLVANEQRGMHREKTDKNEDDHQGMIKEEGRHF